MPEKTGTNVYDFLIVLTSWAGGALITFLTHDSFIGFIAIGFIAVGLCSYITYLIILKKMNIMQHIHIHRHDDDNDD